MCLLLNHILCHFEFVLHTFWLEDKTPLNYRSFQWSLAYGDIKNRYKLNIVPHHAEDVGNE